MAEPVVAVSAYALEDGSAQPHTRYFAQVGSARPIQRQFDANSAACAQQPRSEHTASLERTIHAAAVVGGAVPAGAGNAHALPHKLPSQAHAQGPALLPYQQQIAMQALAQAIQQRSAAEQQRQQELPLQEQQRYAERIRLIEEEENRQMNERRMQNLQAMGVTSVQQQPNRPAPMTYHIPRNPTTKELQAQQRREHVETLRRNAALAAGLPHQPLQPQHPPPIHIGAAQPAWPPPSATPPNPATAAAANLAAAAAAARTAAAAGSSIATATSVDDEEGADMGLGDGVDEQLFANVSTAELEAAGLRPHPDPISETSLRGELWFRP